MTGIAMVAVYMLSRTGSHFEVSEKDRERMLRSRRQRDQILNELADLRVGGQDASDTNGNGETATGAGAPAPVALVPMGGETMALITYMEQLNELAAILGDGDHLMRAVSLEEPETEELFTLDEEQPELQLEVLTKKDEPRSYPYLEQLNDLAAKYPDGLCAAVDVS